MLYTTTLHKVDYCAVRPWPKPYQQQGCVGDLDPVQEELGADANQDAWGHKQQQRQQQQQSAGSLGQAGLFCSCMRGMRSDGDAG